MGCGGCGKRKRALKRKIREALLKVEEAEKSEEQEKEEYEAELLKEDLGIIRQQLKDAELGEKGKFGKEYMEKIEACCSVCGGKLFIHKT